jgi:FtsZ-binding cell division protein ZapB
MNIQKVPNDGMTNKKLRERLENWQKKAANGQERYRNIQVMGLDGNMRTIDLLGSFTDDPFNEEESLERVSKEELEEKQKAIIDEIMDVMPTQERMQKLINEHNLKLKETGKAPQVRTGAVSGKNYDDANHYHEVIIEFDDIPENKREEALSIILDNVSNPHYKAVKSGREFDFDGYRPTFVTELHRDTETGNPSHLHLVVSDRAFEVDEDLNFTTNRNLAFTDRENLNPQKKALEEAFKEAGIETKVHLDYNYTNPKNEQVAEAKTKINEVDYSEDISEEQLDTFFDEETEEFTDETVNKVVKSTLSRTDNEINETLNRLNILRKEREILKRSNQTYKNLSLAKQELAEEKKNHETTKEEKESLILTIQQQKAEFGELFVENEELKERFNGLSNDYENLEESQQALTNENNNLKNSNSELQELNNSLTKTNERLKWEKEEAIKVAKEERAQVNTLNRDNAALSLENSTLKQSDKKQKEEIEKLKAELEQAKAKNIETSNTLTETSQELETTKEEKETVVNKLSGEEEKLKTAKEENTSLKSELETLKSEYQELKEAVEKRLEEDNTNDNDKGNKNKPK